MARRVPAVVWRDAAVIAVVVLAAATSAAARPRAALAPATVYAYLADNTVVRTDDEFRTWRRTRIAPEAALRGGATNSLALSRDRRTLWALSTTGRRLIALDAQTLAARRTIAFGATEVPRAVAVGPRSGRLYVAYTIDHPDPKRRDAPKDARLRILSATGTATLADALVRPAGRRSWWVYALAVDDDERQAYVTYHGSDTTGLDTVAIAGRRLTRCRRPGFLVCWGQPHGAVVPAAGRLYAATGAPWIAEYAPDGTLVRRLETGLGNVHLMKLALTRDLTRIYATPPCPSGSGFASVDLATGETTTTRSTACGDTIAATQTAAIVGAIRSGVAEPNRPGKLLVVDPASGAVLRQRATPSEPVDVEVL